MHTRLRLLLLLTSLAFASSGGWACVPHRGLLVHDLQNEPEEPHKKSCPGILWDMLNSFHELDIQVLCSRKKKGSVQKSVLNILRSVYALRSFEKEYESEKEMMEHFAKITNHPYPTRIPPLLKVQRSGCPKFQRDQEIGAWFAAQMRTLVCSKTPEPKTASFYQKTRLRSSLSVPLLCHAIILHISSRLSSPQKEYLRSSFQTRDHLMKAALDRSYTARSTKSPISVCSRLGMPLWIRNHYMQGKSRYSCGTGHRESSSLSILGDLYSYLRENIK